jgi:hypothetical protein
MLILDVPIPTVVIVIRWWVLVDTAVLTMTGLAVTRRAVSIIGAVMMVAFQVLIVILVMVVTLDYIVIMRIMVAVPILVVGIAVAVIQSIVH